MTKSVSVLVVVGALIACDNDPADPSGSLLGFYEATEFLVSEDGVDRDVLAEGGWITLTLADDGVSYGQIFIPDGGEGGSDFQASYSGTWELLGDSILLEHPQDTFLREMLFGVDGGRLVGSHESESVSMHVEFGPGELPVTAGG